MSLRIEQDEEISVEIEVKRFYIPGVTVYSTCPNCMKEHKFDFDNEYISYPVVNAPEKVHFYCTDCDEAGEDVFEWTEELILRMTLESADKD